MISLDSSLEVQVKKLFKEKFIEHYRHSIDRNIPEIDLSSQRKDGFWILVLDFYIFVDSGQLHNMIRPITGKVSIINLTKGQHFYQTLEDVEQYTVIIPLVQANTDYTGGRIYFPIQNRTLENLESGSAYVIPGQLTHPFEVLPVTSGTFTFVMYKSQAMTMCFQKKGVMICPGFHKIHYHYDDEDENDESKDDKVTHHNGYF